MGLEVTATWQMSRRSWLRTTKPKSRWSATVGTTKQSQAAVNRHEWGRAIDASRAVLEVDPARREDRFELARLLDQEERPIEALAEYEALAKADPRDPLPWAEAGKLLRTRGDRSKAEEAYVEALRLDPHNEEVAESLSRLRQGVDLLAQQMGPVLDGEHAQDELMLRATVPGLPTDPAQALQFDPLGGLRLPPDARPGQ